jgi:hypothetical protein
MKQTDENRDIDVEKEDEQQAVVMALPKNMIWSYPVQEH